jgi:N-methylhydantoinase B
MMPRRPSAGFVASLGSAGVGGPGSALAATGSGGGGAFAGGDGVVREIEALEPLRYSLITERRRHAPRGARGGADGAAGRNQLDGEELPPKAIGELKNGQHLRIETPGGGGYGRP